MIVRNLHKSLAAQLGLLSAAFILLAFAQLVFGWTLLFVSEADLVSETKTIVMSELDAALQEGPEALQRVSQSSVIQKVARANPNLRYYAQSEDMRASFGGEPRLVRHPELLRILQNTIHEAAGGQADASQCGFFGSGNAWLPFEENGIVGNINYSNCHGRQIYMEVAGIEKSAFSRTDLLWSTLKSTTETLSFQQVRDYFLLSGGLLLIASFMFYRVWGSLRKVARLTDSVDLDRSNTHLSETELPLEVRPLVRAVNSMLQRIDESVERQRLFLATAAHELRTPLTILRARMEELPNSDAKASMKNDMKRMSGLVDKMLSLMKLKSGSVMRHGQVNLTQIAREVCAARAPVAIDRGVEIEFDAAAAKIPVQGDAQMISTAISNILDNAISVSGSGDIVTISIGVDGCVEVRDHGPGLPSGSEASIFEPFSKFPPNRNGHGLGLAIVAAIMSLHHGRAEAKNAPDDGAMFSLRFSPAAPHLQGSLQS